MLVRLLLTYIPKYAKIYIVQLKVNRQYNN